MLRRLRPHSIIGTNQQPVHYAFNMQHNLSHLLSKYPETTTENMCRMLQQFDSHISEQMAIRADNTLEVSSSSSKMGMLPLSSSWNSSAEDVIANPQDTMDADEDTEMLYNSRNSLMLHNQALDSNMYEDKDMGSEADLKESLFTTAQSPSPGPSSSSEPSHDNESSAEDVSILMDMIFDGPDSDDEVNTDSSVSEPLASSRKYTTTSSGVPLQPIHNSGTSPRGSTSTPQDHAQSKSPISSDGSAPHYLQTTKNLQSRERRKRRKEKSGRKLQSKLSVKQELKKFHLTQPGPTAPKPRQPMHHPPVKPRQLNPQLEPQLPIKKLTVVGWNNTLSRALKLAETGQDDFEDAKQLAAVLETINRYKDHLPRQLLIDPKLGKSVSKFKHKTPYCQYQLSIKTTARSILGHWTKKFFNKDISGQPLNEASTLAGSTPGL